jgi:hypothetical protein
MWAYIRCLPKPKRPAASLVTRMCILHGLKQSLSSNLELTRYHCEGDGHVVFLIDEQVTKTTLRQLCL